VVYKDVFDRKRDPACYMLKDIKVELGLEREHFINIALCSGSDYTSGISFDKSLIVCVVVDV